MRDFADLSAVMRALRVRAHRHHSREVGAQVRSMRIAICWALGATFTASVVW